MLANIRNLDYVILLCDDLDRMRSFYHRTLGFPIYRELDGWVELRLGAVLLTLRRRDRPYDGEKLPGSAGVQLAFRVPPAEYVLDQTKLHWSPAGDAYLVDTLSKCNSSLRGLRRFL